MHVDVRAAHDPFLQKGYFQHVDAPQPRFRRLLVPFAAWLFGFGQRDWIDEAYIAVEMPVTPCVAFFAAQALVLGAPRLTPLAVQSPLSALTVTVAGQLIVGCWLSTTMTCWVQLLWLPWMSVTVQITVLVPTG